MSGREVNDMPSGKENAACFVEQFTDCMVQFWKNGGSLVLMAENEPMTFQVNEFLTKAEFDGKKVSFKIGGDNPGGHILHADKSGNLVDSASFNALIHKVNNVDRESLAKNLYKLYEGLTVSYAIGKYEPFIPFSKDSKGCINSLFYNGIDRGNGEGEGDIFIDCSYTKFFLEMNKQGTYRYLQNISAFIGSAERRFKTGNHPGMYRPKKVTFALNKDPKYYHKFPQIRIDVCYLVDVSGSMGGSLNKVKNYCVKIAEVLRNEMFGNIFRFGAAFYSDPINVPSETNRYTNLTEDINQFKNYVNGIGLLNGGDSPEDWAGGYDICINKMSWGRGIRLIIHIADAPAHSKLYNNGGDGGDYEAQGPRLDAIIRKSADMNINIVGFKIGSSPDKSYNRIKDIYNSKGNKNCKITNFDQNKTDPTYFTDLVVSSVKGVTG